MTAEFVARWRILSAEPAGAAGGGNPNVVPK